jgi:hypothetical protein
VFSGASSGPATAFLDFILISLHNSRDPKPKSPIKIKGGGPGQAASPFVPGEGLSLPVGGGQERVC